MSGRSSSITNNQNSVVELGGAASGFVVNTRLVELERVVRSIDGNTDGANGGSGGLEIRFASGGNGLEAGHGGGLVGDVVSALQGSSGLVRVARFAVNTVVVDDVLESISHFTTLATLTSVRSGAINKVLFRKSDKGVSREFPLSFHGASGGEGPARAALSLVLDGGDSTSISPINTGWECLGRVGDEQVVLGEWLSALVTVHSSAEFLVGEVSEVVHGELDAGVSGVVLTNELQVLLEDVETGLLFLGRSISASVLGLPFCEDAAKRIILR